MRSFWNWRLVIGISEIEEAFVVTTMEGCHVGFRHGSAFDSALPSGRYIVLCNNRLLTASVGLELHGERPELH